MEIEYRAKPAAESAFVGGGRAEPAGRSARAGAKRWGAGANISKSYYTSGNLILRPLKDYNFTVGAEFLYGWQVLKDNLKGRANRVQVSIQYNLYRKPVPKSRQ